MKNMAQQDFEELQKALDPSGKLRYMLVVPQANMNLGEDNAAASEGTFVRMKGMETPEVVTLLSSQLGTLSEMCRVANMPLPRQMLELAGGLLRCATWMMQQAVEAGEAAEEQEEREEDHARAVVEARS